MAKVSPISTKYIIQADISVEGMVNKPDVIGAIFGQTEGFLGQDLELRELQRSGKVSRIEVQTETNNGKSKGKIIIPCSLDKAEAAIIAASMETIERIGPCNAKVKINKIEDIRTSKRDFVIARAKELLKELQSNVLPDSQELTDEVAHSVRMMEICEWGPDKLAAGPGIDDSDEIILVEGRADVLNLLKNGFKNVIAMNGTNVPDSIKRLCKQKTVTVFVDGDRGGDMIVRQLMDSTEIDNITKAPDGKEVEELTKKEIHIALRAKIAAEQFNLDVNGTKRNIVQPSRNFKKERPQRQSIDIKSKSNFKGMLDDLIGTRGAYIIDKEFNIMGKVPTSELEPTIKEMPNAFAAVFDGSITKEIAFAADTSGLNFIVGTSSKIRQNESKATVLTPKEL